MAVHPVRGGGGGEAGGHFRLCLLGRAQPHPAAGPGPGGRQAAVLCLSGHHAGVRQRTKSAVRLPGAHTEGGHRELAGGAGPVPRPDAGARRICRGAGAAGRPLERCWWTLESRVHTENYEDTVAHLRTLLEGAIRRQLVSDVPLATLLSGGLDSSIITAVAARAYEAAGDPPLETYSFDYTDNEKYFRPSSFQPDADWPWVERMREAFGTRHTVLTCPIPALTRELIPAMNARDLPGMADVDSSLLWFCRQIRRRNTVVISGECADEIFGGYPWFHRPEMLHAETFPWSMDFSARTEVLRGEVVRALELEDYARLRCRASRAETPKLDGEKREEARRREIGWLNLQWFMQNLLEQKFH